RRVRAAVKRHVERDHAVRRSNGRVVEQMSILAAVGAGGVETQQWNPLTRLFHEDAMRASGDLDIEISADDGPEGGRHGQRPSVRMTFIARCSARAFCI